MLGMSRQWWAVVTINGPCCGWVEARGRGMVRAPSCARPMAALRSEAAVPSRRGGAASNSCRSLPSARVPLLLISGKGLRRAEPAHPTKRRDRPHAVRDHATEVVCGSGDDSGKGGQGELQLVVEAGIFRNLSTDL